MLDAVSLNQLRIFIATVEEGSFSAAGRRLSRAQSLISESIGNLEAQLGVALFNRSGRYPRLTEEGSALLSDARAVIARLDGMKARAKDMAAGIEAVAFDRSGFRYHGRIKALADAAREAGLKF